MSLSSPSSPSSWSCGWRERWWMGLGLSRRKGRRRRRRRSIGGRIRRTGCARVPRFINSRWRNLTQCISSPLLHGRSRNPGPPPPPPLCSADSWNFSWHNDFRRNTSSPAPRPRPFRSEHYENCVATGNGWTKRPNYFQRARARVPRNGNSTPGLRAQEFRDRFFHPCDSANRIFRDATPPSRLKRGF